MLPLHVYSLADAYCCMARGSLILSVSLCKPTCTDYRPPQSFPDVEGAYRARTLSRLAGRGLWGVAATWAGVDGALRLQLLGEVRRASSCGVEDMHSTHFECMHWPLNAAMRGQRVGER